MKYIRFFRILLLFPTIFLHTQTLEELSQLRKAYEENQKAKEASEIINQGVNAESDLESTPVRLIVEPNEILNYYKEKMKRIEKDLNQLNRLLISTDSIPPLDYFGYKYFSARDSIQFIDNANIGSNYILGYGDEVIISVWGQAEQYDKVVINRDGTAFINNVGLLYLGGKNIIQAKKYITNRFSKIYSTIGSSPPLTFLEFSIGKVKNINIIVAGHVSYPGNYVVNPSMSLSNLLVLAGGILETGSLRNIKIQRENVIVDSLDLYPLISGIGILKSINLNDNDIIIIPPRGETVAITGAVLNPAYFELKNKNNVNSLLNFSGGFTKNAGKHVVITRLVQPNIYIEKNKFDETILSNGDSLIIPHLTMQYKAISASINNRSLIKIPWIKKLSFRDILKILNIEYKNLKNVELVRLNTDNETFNNFEFEYKNKNIDLLPSDHLSINLVDKFTESKFVVVKGEINSPGIYPLINHSETLNSIISRSGGLKLSSNIKSVIIKRDSLVFGSKTGELILTDRDTVIAKPVLNIVMVKGAVHKPGNIEWTVNNKAKDYIRYSGGLTANADKKHIVLINPYGEASRITTRSNDLVLPGSTIEVSEKILINKELGQERFQQISSLITSMVSLAILASTASN